MQDINAPTSADLERAVHQRHMARVREICGTTFYGTPYQQQAARDALMREAELKAAQERRAIALNRR